MQRKYKYESRKEADDARKQKRNRARAERRCRAHKHLMAAEEEAHSKMQYRGGAKKWKHAMKRVVDSQVWWALLHQSVRL